MLMTIHWKTDTEQKQREMLLSLCHIEESALKKIFPLWVAEEYSKTLYILSLVIHTVVINYPEWCSEILKQVVPNCWMWSIVT